MIRDARSVRKGPRDTVEGVTSIVAPASFAIGIVCHNAIHSKDGQAGAINIVAAFLLHLSAWRQRSRIGIGSAILKQARGVVAGAQTVHSHVDPMMR